MKKLEIHQDWIAPGSGIPEFSQTMAHLSLYAGSINLTENINIWSRSVHKNIVVSSYPLAMWFAHVWWRLLYEPVPTQTMTTDWRMAHEMGTANHGFVWPQIAFATDSEQIHIWSAPSGTGCEQSAKYLNGLSHPYTVGIDIFQNALTEFVSTVINRLEACEVKNSDLSGLWTILLEERANADSVNYRKREAQMGFDPDECEPALVEKALELSQRFGESTLTELAPVYGASIGTVEAFMDVPGIKGKPDLPEIEISEQQPGSAPWKKAVEDARAIRQQATNDASQPLDNKILCDLLGIHLPDFEKWVPPNNRSKVSLAIPADGNTMKFIPRKTHPASKRFELARFMADSLYTKPEQNHWLTVTDISTASQKYQKAFAAELLCPVHGLQAFLQNDFSETAIEDAANHFKVSEMTVTSLLKNNGLILSNNESSYPGWDRKILAA